MEETQLGQYRLLQRLGAGGMGEVFLASLEREEGFSKLLVLKRILPALSDSSRFREMFASEARIAASLNHPHIIQVTDYGKIGRNCFLAMEYIQGTDLAALLGLAQQQRRPPPMDFLAGVGLACLRALGYAHNRKEPVVHGDVSPQNILVGREGEVKLCDFGLARLSGPPSPEQHQEVRGKLSYLPPEVAFGQRPGVRSDLFGVGAILYEMAAGVPPLPPVSDFDQALLQARRSQIPPVSQVHPGIHPALAHVIDRALCTRIEDRFEDAAEMEGALDRIAATLGLDPSPRAIGRFVTEVLGEGGVDTSPRVPRTLVAALPAARKSRVRLWALLTAGLAAALGMAWLLLPGDTQPSGRPRPPASLGLSPAAASFEEPASHQAEDAGTPEPADAREAFTKKPHGTGGGKRRKLARVIPDRPDAGTPAQPDGAAGATEPAVTVREPGFILRTSRQATYSLDGGPEQPTPVVVPEGLSGVHILKIRDRQGLSATLRIEARGERGTLKLAFRSQPYAILSVDGHPRGLTPLAEINIGRGAHVFSLAVPKSKHVLVLNMEIR